MSAVVFAGEVSASVRVWVYCVHACVWEGSVLHGTGTELAWCTHSVGGATAAVGRVVLLPLRLEPPRSKQIWSIYNIHPSTCPQLVGTTIFGPLADRFGRWKASVASAVLIACAGLISAFSVNYAMLVSMT